MAMKFPQRGSLRDFVSTLNFRVVGDEEFEFQGADHSLQQLVSTLLALGAQKSAAACMASGSLEAMMDVDKAMEAMDQENSSPEALELNSAVEAAEGLFRDPVRHPV